MSRTNVIPLPSAPLSPKTAAPECPQVLQITPVPFPSSPPYST